jgi:hypothetical protein
MNYALFFFALVLLFCLWEFVQAIFAWNNLRR